MNNSPKPSLRNYFAGQALIGVLQRAQQLAPRLSEPDALATQSFKIADAMCRKATTEAAPKAKE